MVYIRGEIDGLPSPLHAGMQHILQHPWKILLLRNNDAFVFLTTVVELILPGKA
jgi:hypothetical protein